MATIATHLQDQTEAAGLAAPVRGKGMVELRGLTEELADFWRRVWCVRGVAKRAAENRCPARGSGFRAERRP